MKLRVPLPRPIWIAAATAALVVVAVGIQVGLPVYRQHRAVLEIKRLNGYFEVRFLGPKWFREFIGKDQLESFAPVTKLSLSMRYDSGAKALHFPKRDASDANLEVICGLTSLEDLNISYPQVTDADLKHVVRLRRLRRLSLEGTQITDTGLTDLKNLRQLEFLDLRFSFITDEGLKQLQGFTTLKELYLRGTDVTEDGIAELQEALTDLTVYF